MADRGSWLIMFSCVCDLCELTLWYFVYSVDAYWKQRLLCTLLFLFLILILHFLLFSFGSVLIKGWLCCVYTHPHSHTHTVEEEWQQPARIPQLPLSPLHAFCLSLCAEIINCVHVWRRDYSCLIVVSVVMETIRPSVNKQPYLAVFG